MLNYYGKLCTEVYDIDKPIGHSFGDIEFYKERLKNITGKILEPAVGTGRLLIPLLEDGFDIEGFDYSIDMLSVCKQHCQNRNLSPKLYQDNMLSFSSHEKFEAIIIPTGTFLLIKNREDSLKALQIFYDHLKEGGRLILDLFLQPDFKPQSSSLKTWQTSQGDIITLEEKQIKIDHINQEILSYMKYEKWSQKKLIQTELEEFSLRWYGIEEFRLILEKIGFKDIIISSDYQHKKYPSEKTEMITFEASR